MKHLLTCAAIATTAAFLSLAPHAQAAATATLPGPAFPVFKTPDEVKGRCDAGLKAANAAIGRLERLPANRAWLGAYDDLNALAEDAAGAIYLSSNVHPDKAIRDATEACELRWADFYSTQGQNEKLYAKARQIQPGDAIDREFLKTVREGFEDAGVSLPADRRKRAKEINDKITALAQTFDKNVRDANIRLAFDEAELKGVPEAVWKNAKRNDQGKLLLGVDYPTYGPVMDNAVNPATREKMWRAKTNEGGEANLKLLAEIGQLRREYAQLFGFASFADFTLRRRMAESLPNAKKFLGEVQQAVAEREKKEIEELRAAKAADLSQPLAEVTLNRWDVAFYTEKLKRQRYSVDQEAFRPYFPPQESLAFVFRVIEKMMGVRYERVADVALWHPEAQAYAVRDVRSGKVIAKLLVDLYPREGKYNHAAVWSYRNGAQRGNRAPQAALVVNFDRKGLTLDELETLLHELGHAVHNNLSSTRYSSQAGTSTLRDFVEAPSQMLEDWVYERPVLDVMREVCPACKPVPDDLLKQAKVAKHFGKGVRYARQQLYASFDLGMHDTEAPEPMALWAKMEGATPLGHVSGTMFPAGFSHLAGGYAAGYYGYLWSEVVAADLRTAFEADKLSPVVGARYRRIVLGNGGQRPPQDIVREFLGRPTDAKAFYKELSR
jgi:thimet oligopeptidase